MGQTLNRGEQGGATSHFDGVVKRSGTAEVRSITLAKASGAQNRIDVSGVMKDGLGAVVPFGRVAYWLSDDDTDGIGLSVFSPSTPAAVQTKGKLFPLNVVSSVEVAGIIEADINGEFELRWTDTAQEGFVLVVLPLHGADAPTLLAVVTGDYTD